MEREFVARTCGAKVHRRRRRKTHPHLGQQRRLQGRISVRRARTKDADTSGPRATRAGSRAYGIGAAFDAAYEGEILDDGGTVETTYNERDQPLEAKILDDEGVVLLRITTTQTND